MLETTISWIILGMGSANERRRYIVTPSLIGRAHSHNDPCMWYHSMWVWLLLWLFWFQPSPSRYFQEKWCQSWDNTDLEQPIQCLSWDNWLLSTSPILCVGDYDDFLLLIYRYLIIDTLRLEQNGCHFADAIFKYTFLNENDFQLTVSQHWLR